IPHKIWQIILPKKSSKNKPIDPKQLPDTLSWIAMNPDYAYTLMGPKGGEAFVEQHFSDDPLIVETYQNLIHVGMKPDLLRYLILSVEGGVYADTDTIALKPIDLWIPENLQDKVRLVVGLEFDQRDGGPWADITHPVQFCQWTLAALPGHPVFPKMVAHVLRSVKKLSEKYQVPLGELKPTSLEVMEATAPAAWTDVLFEQLQEYDPSLNSTKDFSYMTEPKLYGDVLVYPIDAFGMGQPHSGSTNDGSIPKIALARHLFRGSWR
ncbi:glycosyltransferase family 32 protein, partial [Oidiodendron maius Zn]